MATKPLQVISPLHREIIRMKVLGYKTKEIAADLGLNISSVSRILSDEKVKTLLNVIEISRDDHTTRIRKTLDDTSEYSATLLGEYVRDEGLSPALRVRIAQDALDRGGHGKVIKKEIKKEDSSRMSQRLLKRMKDMDEDGREIEVEVEIEETIEDVT